GRNRFEGTGRALLENPDVRAHYLGGAVTRPVRDGSAARIAARAAAVSSAASRLMRMVRSTNRFLSPR
ncbi:MAG: hypothetical protein ACREKB_13635, partial [Candidatus Rokuibacteriota bacterium]